MKYFLFLFLQTVAFCAFNQTERINFTAPFQYPEGVTYDPAEKVFYLSSARTGTIGRLTMDGKYDSVVIDSSIKSSFGLRFEKNRKLIWACTGDPNYSKYSDSATYKKMIRLLGIDLKTKKVVHAVDLSSLYPGKHFANDLTMDSLGIAYITDSYAPVIYRVDTAGKASVFAENDLFKGTGIGLNGIVLFRNEFLIVANGSTGSLLKVNIQNPKAVTKIKIDQFFSGADGLLWDDEGNLIVIQNKGSNKIYKLNSKDNWESANVVAATKGTDRFAQPSTGVLANGKVYIMNSKLNELQDPTMPPSQEFSLQVARFIPVK